MRVLSGPAHIHLVVCHNPHRNFLVHDIVNAHGHLYQSLHNLRHLPHLEARDVDHVRDRHIHVFYLLNGHFYRNLPAMD